MKKMSPRVVRQKKMAHARSLGAFIEPVVVARKIPHGWSFLFGGSAG